MACKRFAEGLAVRAILEKLARGEITVEEAERALRLTAIEEVGEAARLDVGREFRTRIPEIVLGEGKAREDVLRIAERLLAERGRAIISRVSEEQVKALEEAFRREGVQVEVHKRARIVVLRREEHAPQRTGGRVGVIAAGTADIPVAEEARVIAQEMGCEVLTAYDIGVAGIHRLFPALKLMLEADVDVLVVVAGREGALPSVVAGLVDVPVIGVPTSVGYGLGAGGVSALMAMLQSCSLGLTVVNIDAGVAAGAAAALIANRVAEKARRARGDDGRGAAPEPPYDEAHKG